ncbi:Dimethylaniline monooxygenase (N-oxide forming) [Plesiocystis pacifica SIR-1]|uniref:Dimethylaniline monooxygenase (N-oxide forming) n=1 Tax=Plesiocystis pacifica SIR-1 TaxID=391625 RepID=A6G4K6_9BACT|nr:NAD(P)-binding domain-containing protein [Plesiocystis pacifica]EDM79126.1 Dimethylaniline monooxygenase (N-oxide forming) [Plesiocystis pacifica SIR-1]
MNDRKRCAVIGAGISGLLAAKELIDAGVGEVVILEKAPELGGVWSRFIRSRTILTSSKWITEFSTHPMPGDYPDFLTIQQMLAYVRSFVERFELGPRIRCGVEVLGVERGEDGRYALATSEGELPGFDFVVVSTGLHGEPTGMDIPGLDEFEGTAIHGSTYTDPEPFRDKRVLSIGLGESGVAVCSEVHGVAAKTYVSSTGFTGATRVFPYTMLAADQMQFWPLGEYMKDYQEVATAEMSWYFRLPEAWRPAFRQAPPHLEVYPEQWRPKDIFPYRWHAKFFPKPATDNAQDTGNMTRPGSPPDDVLWLAHSGQVVPKGRVERFEGSTAHFTDGSAVELDAVIVNAGFTPTLLKIDFPDGWQYRHLDLYKGCFHPDLPNVAFVGLVRPTIGSLTAMAEMQSRLVAQVFTGGVQLPEREALRALIEREAKAHVTECPTMLARVPHVYFFDQWMEEVAELVGCRPRARDHLGSIAQLRAYWFGSPMPLRFRMRGPGALPDARERYAKRITKNWSGTMGKMITAMVLIRFAYPFLLSAGVGATLALATSLPLWVALVAGLAVLGLYMVSDLFRMVVSLPFVLPMLDFGEPNWERLRKISPATPPDYASPGVFQNDGPPADQVMRDLHHEALAQAHSAAE